jgi:hypothetical protein
MKKIQNIKKIKNIKKYFLILIFIILIIGIIFIYSTTINNSKILKKEFCMNNIIFLNSNELFEILSADKDNYYKTFLKYDFSTRNIKNIDDYIPKIKESVCNFTDLEKNKVIKSINYINSKLNNLNLPYFDGKLASKIPWKIGLIKGNLYENGYPHTRNDVIILSKNTINAVNMEEDEIDKNFTQTLIHERIHIYQKMYPKYVKIYLSQNNFKKIKNRDINDNIRANPDTDLSIYKDGNNIVYKALYKNNPNNIGDINYFYGNSQIYEHPYEKMAIEFEKYI